MRKLKVLIILTIVALLSGCSKGEINNYFDVNESYDLEALLEVSRPVEQNQQDDEVLGVEIENVSVVDIDWQVFYESELYSILYRDVPQDMLFFMIGYPIDKKWYM